MYVNIWANAHLPLLPQPNINPNLLTATAVKLGKG